MLESQRVARCYGTGHAELTLCNLTTSGDYRRLILLLIIVPEITDRFCQPVQKACLSALRDKCVFLVSHSITKMQKTNKQ